MYEWLVTLSRLHMNLTNLIMASHELELPMFNTLLHRELFSSKIIIIDHGSCVWMFTLWPFMQYSILIIDGLQDKLGRLV